jgi:hypothetical protein
MFTHQEGLGQCQHFILGQIPVLILAVEDTEVVQAVRRSTLM